MNLFSSETEQVLRKYVSEDWAEVLSQYIDLIAFNEIKNKVSASRTRGQVYPESINVFRALQTPFKDIKVVVIGQDPYHNGNADGISFSCRRSLSPSLSNIIEAISNDLLGGNTRTNVDKISIYLKNKNNWNLNYLVQQGVLLYNPTLTVEEGRPGSHKGIWTLFTDAVFKALSNKKDLVWMAWGKDAYDSMSRVIKKDGSQLYLLCEHPAAAAYRKEAWKCDHFTKCNDWLKSKGLIEIEWLQR